MKRYSRTTTVPFAGFYESSHDEQLDWALEQMMSDDSGDQFGGLLMRVFWDCNWRAVHEEYAREYVVNLAAEFKLKLLYERMISPREYNFTTDRIFAYIPLVEVRRLRRETAPEVLNEVVLEMFTSRSGFSSSYANDVREWPGIAAWDHNQIGALLAAYIRQENGGKDMDQYRESELMEYDRDNGAFEQWIDKHTKNMGRYWEIKDYLQKRKERKQHA